MKPLWRRFAPSRPTKVNDMQATDSQPEAEASAIDSDIQALIAERDAARDELAKAREQFLREHAELENTRRRLSRDVEQSRKFANERLLGSLLPVFDSLEAGIAAAKDLPQVREGLELTLRQLERIAQANGLVAVAPAAGDAFNPEHHQAMSLVDAAGVAPGAVAQTCQKGYLLNDRLLRPALVMVAKHD